MRGMTNGLTIGERVAWYRRRRGMSQEVLAGLVGRTTDWLSKLENNRIDLDRLSVITQLADVLDVALGDLLGEPSLVEWTGDSGGHTVPALRAVLMDYRLITPFASPPTAAPQLTTLEREVGATWDAYQAARFGYVAGRLPSLIADAVAATEACTGAARRRAFELLALTYQLAETQLTKFGEGDLAWIAADRGLVAARNSDNPAIVGTLFRTVAHALLSTGRQGEAVHLTEQAASYLRPTMDSDNPTHLSVYGTMLLVGSMAAARAGDRTTVRTFMDEAELSAQRQGGDANHLWTAFGPTNVAIHRVATAAELGDVQVAIDLGPRVDTAAMPMERRVRHALEVARAYSSWNRTDEAIAAVLDAEQLAPEQVRYHYLSRQLVLSWVRRTKGRPSTTLTSLAQRLQVLE